ncbi:MAG TPA: hypothetical protein ENI97_02815 [Gammaproteobacteria bacterium]|nr:hypothetical protein [Gammaproteobacteria bacterium]
MSKRLLNLVYLSMASVTLISGYAYLRYAYEVTDHFPFTQEIVLIILGTLATIFITSLLLNKQTEIEIEKEQRVRYLEIKTSTYQLLLDLLEEMALLDHFTNKELIRLQFVTHKLAVIASPEVIDEYQSFLGVISSISDDNSFSGDMSLLSESLGSLSLQIRKDILGSNTSMDYSDSRISAMIKENSKASFFNTSKRGSENNCS